MGIVVFHCSIHCDCKLYGAQTNGIVIWLMLLIRWFDCVRAFSWNYAITHRLLLIWQWKAPGLPFHYFKLIIAQIITLSRQTTFYNFLRFRSANHMPPALHYESHMHHCRWWELTLYDINKNSYSESGFLKTSQCE